MEMSKGGHQLVKLETLGEWSQERSVLYKKENDVSMNRSYIEKVHRVLNHKGVMIMDYAFRSAERLEPGMMKMIKEVVDEM